MTTLAEPIVTPSPVRPIPTVGIHYDVPAEIYFAWDAVNASFLKRMARSAAHARWETDNPTDPTEAMLQGSCCHTCTLEPDEIEKRYAVADDCISITGKGGTCGNSGKILSAGRWYCGVHGKKVPRDPMPQVIGEDGDLINAAVVTVKQMAKAQAMAISVRRNRAAQELLNACRKEVCIVWVDPVTGVLCKARLDGYDDVNWRISDLKTCENASEDEFPKQIGDMGYDIQAAMYLDAATSLDGVLHDAFYFIAVEKSAPFVSVVYKAHQGMIALGRHRYRRLLTDYKWCVENNYWPGYADHQILPIQTTRYFFERESKK